MPKKSKDETPSIDFSFNDVEKEIDETLKQKAKDEPERKVSHISDKIRQGMKIKENLPEKGFLEFKAEEIEITNKDGSKRKALLTTTIDTEGVAHVEVTSGLYVIDLRNDAEFWFIRSPTVVPQMIQQAVRSSIDRKKCYEPEKRKLDIPIWLIAGIAIGSIIIIWMLVSMMG